VSGSLTLDGTELVLSGRGQGDCAIKMEDGGKLTVIAGSVIRSSDPDVHYTFAVYSGGRLTMNDSRIADCGWDDLENGGDNPEDVRGPYIASDRVAITNSTFTQNGFGLIIDGGSAPLVQYCNISRNHADGIMILGDSSQVIDRNTLVGNALTYPWFLCYQADISAYGGAPRINNNTIGAVAEDGWAFPNEGIVLGDGSPVSLAANGSFSVQVPLETGPNAIRVTVRDAAGNQAETVIEVTREKAPAGKSTPGFECVLALSAMALALAAWRKGK
jgi:hypothetical protein